MFVTFYSYKGGVGRTLALANIACLMAEDPDHPQKMLIWDFDFEAPGIHKLFPPKNEYNHGFVDYVYEYATTGEVPDIRDYIFETEIEGVSILPAGEVGELYCDKLQQIDWLKLFFSDNDASKGFWENVIGDIKAIDDPFDYVFVDSRTGFNDLAGICTQVLAELLVVLFRLNDQNLDGLEHIVPSIKSQLSSRKKDSVEIIPIATHVETTSSQMNIKSKKAAEKIFGENLDYILFDPNLVSDEKLICLSKELHDIWPTPPIVKNYKDICSVIRKNNAQDTETLSDKLIDNIREEDFASAIDLIEILLMRRPKLSYLWRYLSHLYFNELNNQQKHTMDILVDEIFKKDSKNIYALRWKAYSEVFKSESPESAELEEAKKYLNQALLNSSGKEKAGTLKFIASIESCQGRIDESINILRHVKETYPENIQLSLDLADLFIRKGGNYFTMAVDELNKITSKKVLQKNISLSYLLTFLGDFDNANRQVELIPDSLEKLVKSHILLIKNEEDKAIKLVESGQEEIHENHMAEFYICAGKFDKALEILSKANINNNPTYLMNLLARYFSGQKKGSFESEKLPMFWNFLELLFFVERFYKSDKAVNEGRDIIEQLIREIELKEIKSGIGMISEYHF